MSLLTSGRDGAPTFGHFANRKLSGPLSDRNVTATRHVLSALISSSSVLTASTGPGCMHKAEWLGSQRGSTEREVGSLVMVAVPHDTANVQQCPRLRQAPRLSFGLRGSMVSVTG